MSPSTKASSVRQFFSRHGALSQWHPNYEYRPGQLEMAEAVESALTGRKCPSTPKKRYDPKYGAAAH
jgi:hypothetical protein